jgi:hypothetical protein
MSTQTITVASAEPVLRLRSGLQTEEAKLQDQPEDKTSQSHYQFAHLLPAFSHDEHYPPLEPYEHNDPGHRALTHENPLGYLKLATSISEITPSLGTEVRGVQLDKLDSDARDELALHVKSSCLSTKPILDFLPTVSGCPTWSLGVQRPGKFYQRYSRGLLGVGQALWPVSY